MRQPDLFRATQKPWNAGRPIGQKAPLKPKHIWTIQPLKTNAQVRDLAMFNCALDAKLRGCDLVKRRISDVAMGGSIRLRSTVMRQNIGRPVSFEITEPAGDALAAWLRVRRGRPDAGRHGAIRLVYAPASSTAKVGPVPSMRRAAARVN